MNDAKEICITQTTIIEPKIRNRVSKRMVELKNRYHDLLTEKISRNSDNDYSYFNSHKIDDAIRKIAVQVNAKSYVQSLNEEEMELALIIMEDIYFYLLNGYVPKKGETI